MQPIGLLALPGAVTHSLPPPPPSSPPPSPPPSPPSPPAGFSDEQQDDHEALGEATHCRVRQRLLTELALAAAAAEPAIHVSALAARTGIDQNTVSHHLAVLRHGGYVRARKQGKHTYYTVVPSRVRVDRPPGALSLTLTHPSGSYLTIGVPNPVAQVRSAEPARVTEPDVESPQPRDAG